MAFIDMTVGQLSDLVVHEVDPEVGYARRMITVQKAGDLTMGTLVFRTKAAAESSAAAPYAEASTTELSSDNEFAVVFGDVYSCKDKWTVGASDTAVNSVAFVRGEVVLKDKLVMASINVTSRTDADYLKLKRLLENQGIVIEATL